MLSERRKMLIEMEERYRAEIRSSLAEEKRENKIVRFCNTNFGLFLLSTVFVSVFSAVFSWSVTQYKTVTDRNERERRLRIEITNRLEEVETMKGRFRFEYHDVIKTSLYGFRIGETQNASHKLFYTAIFPEYRERSLFSLFAELEGLAPHDVATVRAARARVRPLARYLYSLVEEREPPPPGSSETEPRSFCVLQASDQKAFLMELDAFKPFMHSDPK